MVAAQVAVVGGHSRHVDRVRWPDGYEVSHFESTRYGGAGEHRSLVQSIRNGKFDGVVILKKWIGHSESDAVRKLCGSLGVPARIWPFGMSGIVREIPNMFTAVREENVADAVEESEITVVEDREPVSVPFREALKRAMEEAGVNQTELAEILEISTVQSYTSGHRVPHPYVYGRLLSCFPSLEVVSLPSFRGPGGVEFTPDFVAREIARGRDATQRLAAPVPASPAPPPLEPVHMTYDEVLEKVEKKAVGDAVQARVRAAAGQLADAIQARDALAAALADAEQALERLRSEHVQSVSAVGAALLRLGELAR